ncbi:MAG TPA: ABC transporter permease [Spirochaetes bacterium]|nr:ABC transporter permease [Spirochaetota bacterium]
MKSLVRCAAIAGKEWLQIRRDMRSLILSLIAPALLIVLFGYALTVDVSHVSTAVLDRDKSTLSRRFLEKFSHTEYIDVSHYINTYREADDLINSGKASMVLVVPRGFEKNFKSGKKTAVQVLADGSDSTSATVAMGYVSAIVAQYNMDIKVEELKRVGVSNFTLPVEVRSRVWYNPELLSKNFIIPGLIVIVLAIISALIASLAVSREWERGTMETLITTPVRSWEVVAGKLIPYLLIGLFDVILSVAVGYFIFGVPVRGSFVEFYLLAILFLAGTSTLGILISSATRVQVLSVQVAMVATYLPSFILSGFVFPIQNMPLPLQGLTYLIPARYLIVLVKGIALKGVGALFMWTQILFLGCFFLLVLALSIKKLELRLPDA